MWISKTEYDTLLRSVEDTNRLVREIYEDLWYYTHLYEDLKERFDEINRHFRYGNEKGIGEDTDQKPDYPSSFDLDNVISVANLMSDGSLAESSNFGAKSVDIAAPGTYIVSTIADGGYGLMTGTSISAPKVAGAAAI